MADILLTGFLPFDGDLQNPSQLLVEQLCAEPLGLVGCVLPVDAVEGPRMLREALQRHRPRATLCLGLGSTLGIRIETTARNICNFRIPDAAGRYLRQYSIREDGPASYPVTLPLSSIEKALQLEGIESNYSHDAGGYLCNLILYTLLDVIAQENKSMHAGFIHLPRLPEMPLLPSHRPMDLVMQCRAIRAVVAVLRAK
jgi:pyroglutamyl-peptidase